MNISAKCNCCMCAQVCKYKDVYDAGKEAILNACFSHGDNSIWKVKECPHIEVSIRCPHMITGSMVKEPVFRDVAEIQCP